MCKKKSDMYDLRNVGDKNVCRLFSLRAMGKHVEQLSCQTLDCDNVYLWDTQICVLDKDLVWLNLIICCITYRLKNKSMWPRRDISKCFENVIVFLFKIRDNCLSLSDFLEEMVWKIRTFQYFNFLEFHDTFICPVPHYTKNGKAEQNLNNSSYIQRKGRE